MRCHKKWFRGYQLCWLSRFQLAKKLLASPSPLLLWQVWMHCKMVSGDVFRPTSYPDLFYYKICYVNFRSDETHSTNGQIVLALCLGKWHLFSGVLHNGLAAYEAWPTWGQTTPPWADTCTACRGHKSVPFTSRERCPDCWLNESQKMCRGWTGRDTSHGRKCLKERGEFSPLAEWLTV